MHSTMILVTFFPVVLIACLLPWMGRTRRGVLFGVTVPLEFAAGAEAQMAVRRYRGGVALLALAVGMAALAVLAFGHVRMLPVVSAVAVPVELLGGLLLWERERRRMMAHATTVPLVRSAELLPQRSPVGLFASVSALLPLAAMALWLRAHWDLIPARWPQHWNANFQVDGWGVRSVAGVFLPLMIGAVVVLMMAAVAAMLAFAPGPQSKARRLVLAPIAGLSWLIAATFCGVGLLPLHGSLSVQAIVAVVVAQLVVALGLSVWMVVRSGVLAWGPRAEAYDSTPDAMWRGGIVYYNPGDAAVIVPKRYGFGWTLNFARPVAWLYLGGVVLVVAFVAVAPLLLRK